MKQNIVLYRSLTVALCLIMVSVMYVSCSDPGKSSDDTTKTEQNQLQDETTTPEITYPYPEFDFEEQELKFLARKDNYCGQDYNDIWVEGMNGDVLNDAVYSRTTLVEEKYNVKISVTTTLDPAMDTIRNVHSGDDTFQVVQDKLVNQMTLLAARGNLYNVFDLPGVNIDAPWYNQNLAADLSINHKLLVLAGDMTVSDKIGVAAVMFNKKIVTDLDMENPYALVKENRWTIDKLNEMMTAGALDLNGDQTMSKEADRWGLICEGYYAWNMLVSGGCRIAEKDENDLPYLTIYTEKTVNMLDKIMQVLYNKQARAGTGFSGQDYLNVFAEDRALFHMNVMSTIVQYRDMQSNYGIIPMPKFDANQDEYITTMSPWVSRLLSVPTTNQRVEMTGAVLDALFRESVGSVRTAYYENLLGGKIARDPETIEMLDIVFDSVVYDIGSIFNWGKCWDNWNAFIMAERTDFASFYQSNEKVYEAELSRTIETFTKLD